MNKHVRYIRARTVQQATRKCYREGERLDNGERVLKRTGGPVPSWLGWLLGQLWRITYYTEE